MQLFVYGTLCDADMRALVLGAWAGAAVPAVVRGWRAVQVRGAHYPALRSQAAGCVQGLVLTGMSLPTLSRVGHYESDEYRVSRCQPLVLGHGAVDAMIFLARRDVPLTGRSWRLAEWQRRHKRAALLRIDTWMSRWRAGNPLEPRGLPFRWRQIERLRGFDLGALSD